MYAKHTQPAFHSPMFYISMDVLFVVVSLVYLVGDSVHMDNALKYLKPFPIWIMMAQLWSLRSVYKQVNTIIWGLFFGSVGDICLLFQDQADFFFEAGAVAFLIGHLFYIPAFINMTIDITEGKIRMRKVLSEQRFFITIWMILVSLSFWSICTMVKSLSPEQQFFMYVLSIYGSCLLLFAIAGFFFYFNTSHIKSKTIFYAGLCFMVGALSFFTSDNFLAHGKFNIGFQNLVRKEKWEEFVIFIVFISYFGAQFLVTKGTLLVTAYFAQQAPLQVKIFQKQESP